MSTSGIVAAQQHVWYVFALLPSFLIYVDLDGRRDQPRAVRPARGRGRAGRRLPHRVLVAEVRDVLARRVHQHGDRLGAGDHDVPRRLARAVADLALGRRELRAGGRCCGSPSRSGLLVRVHLAARHAAAAALRPVHAARLEGPDPGLAGLDDGGGHGPSADATRATRSPRPCSSLVGGRRGAAWSWRSGGGWLRRARRRRGPAAAERVRPVRRRLPRPAAARPTLPPSPTASRHREPGGRADG